MRLGDHQTATTYMRFAVNEETRLRSFSYRSRVFSYERQYSRVEKYRPCFSVVFVNIVPSGNCCRVRSIVLPSTILK